MNDRDPSSGDRQPGSATHPKAPGTEDPNATPRRQKPTGKGSTVAMMLALAALLAIFLIALALLSYIMSALMGDGRDAGGGFAYGKKIGIVNITGMIAPGENFDFWLHTLDRLGRDNSIRGLLVYIESPGGAVASSQEIAAAIEKVRRERGKPVFAAMGNTAASGGYYIAAAADRIFAMKGTLTGSIGVLFTKPNIQQLASQLGVEVQTITSGEFKNIGDITKPLDPRQQQLFQMLIDDTHQQFLDDVIKHREPQLKEAAESMAEADWDAYMLERPNELTARQFLAAMADGRVLTGRQAMKMGLIDQIGTREDAMMALAQRIGLPPPIKTVEPQPERSLFDLFSLKIDKALGRQPGRLEYLIDLP